MRCLLPNDGKMVSGHPGSGNSCCLDKNNKTLTVQHQTRALLAVRSYRNEKKTKTLKDYIYLALKMKLKLLIYWGGSWVLRKSPKQIKQIEKFTNNYHEGQLIGVSWGTRQGCQAGADLVVPVTTPNRQNCDVPELFCTVHPLLSDCSIEIYMERRQRQVIHTMWHFP